MSGLAFRLVDVFSSLPYGGNSLAVFPESAGLESDQMLAITRELRHFESIFLEAAHHPSVWNARVFDLEGELGFAGHPVMGAASVVHDLAGVDAPESSWEFHLPEKAVTVTTEPTATGHMTQMDQGPPVLGHSLPDDRFGEFTAALDLAAADLDREHVPQVVSTGLAYLVVPVAGALERARIVDPDFEELLASIGAEFVYVIDIEAMEGRHWNNDGLVEDVATGSGAGTVAAYLVHKGIYPPGETFLLRQGRFVGRPSQITLRAVGARDDIRSVQVGGPVSRVGYGNLQHLPEPAG